MCNGAKVKQSLMTLIHTHIHIEYKAGSVKTSYERMATTLLSRGNVAVEAWKMELAILF